MAGVDEDTAHVRAMRPDDISAAQLSSFEALTEAGTRYGYSMPVLSEQGRRVARLRFAHLLRTDPDGCWVAEQAAEVVGVGLSLRRGGLWFLSLLTVARGMQSQGVGRQLLDAALATAGGAAGGLIMASPDPKALRRYGQAGFDLVPGYRVTGRVDRRALPAVPGVREGSYEDDRELVDDIGLRLRGAGYGPDLDAYREAGRRLVVTDAADGRGFAVLHDAGAVVLGATSDAAAARLLWFALAEADPGGDVEVEALTAAQQWAVRVALQARLTLTPGESLCVRGRLGTLTPYLPGGAYGWILDRLSLNACRDAGWYDAPTRNRAGSVRPLRVDRDRTAERSR